MKNKAAVWMFSIGILSAFALYKRGDIVKNEWSEHEKKTFMEKCVEGSYSRKEDCTCVMHKLMKEYSLDKPVDAAGIDEAVSECLYEN